jgi:hypothetical protein
MAVPEVAFSHMTDISRWSALLFRTLFAESEGRDVIMNPMNSCEVCEKQRKGVNGRGVNKDAILTLFGKHIHRVARGTNVDKRKPKEVKEGKNKRRLRSVTGCRSDKRSSSDQLSQPAGAIADSQSKMVENGAARYRFEFVPSTATAPPNPGFPSISTLSDPHGDAPPTGSHPARPSVVPHLSAPSSRSRFCSRSCCTSTCCSSCCVAPLFFPRRPPPSPA